ncbi:hypothetical protein KAR91_69715 [Candidatus Pacearchaeota archaeon]|nr:hypothetical protein [Candidatus Pacearchaeota archaeon]
MTEEQEYYYHKGKMDGFIMGTEAGNKLIYDFVSKTSTPPPIVIKCEMNPKICKLLKELKC